MPWNRQANMVENVILISCAKTKRNTPSAAKDLYQSDLFRSMRCYAEENADSWYILSAKHGVHNCRHEQGTL